MSTTKSMLGPIQVQVQWVRGHRLHKSQYPLVNEKNINFSYLEINGLVPDILITNVRKTLSLSQLFQQRILDALEGPISFLPFFFFASKYGVFFGSFPKDLFLKIFGKRSCSAVAVGHSPKSVSLYAKTCLFLGSVTHKATGFR